MNLDGVHKGIDFLLNANLGYRFTIGKKVVVIGGGNVAMDVARSAAREVLKQHVPGETEHGTEPSAENVSAVATHEMVDISLSALRLGAHEVSIVWPGAPPRDARGAGRSRGSRTRGHRPARRPGPGASSARTARS